MFENIGKKIKMLAKVIFWFEAIGFGIAGLAAANDTEGLSMLIALGGILVAWISSWFLYGFGEIIDKLTDIERNTRGGEIKSDTQAKIDKNRAKTLEELRSQGMITETEYQQAISQNQ